MSYDAPTPADFKARFPIFANVPDPTIQIFLTEAGAHIDDSWEESDYQPAIMYLAAHLYATDNSAAGSTPITGGRRGPLSSESFSGMSRSYGSAGGNSNTGSAASEYGATEYGRRYWQLLKNNKPAISVV